MRKRMVLVLCAVAALTAGLSTAVAGSGSGLLASGSVWEDVGAPGPDGDWHIQFALYSQDSKHDGSVTVQADNRLGPSPDTFSFDTSVCSGSFGTTAYGVGVQTSATNESYFTGPYFALSVSDGGPGGVDYSTVYSIPNLATAQFVCAHPTTTVPPVFVVDGGNVVFKG